jgi:hypothetical protein
VSFWVTSEIGLQSAQGSSGKLDISLHRNDAVESTRTLKL